jgi:hypothetical protein
MINILADNVLLLGYSKGKKKITPAMVKQSYDDMKLNDSSSKSTHKNPVQHELRKVEQTHTGRYWKWATSLFFIIVIVSMVISEKGQNILSQLAALIPVTHQAPVREIPKKQALVYKKINEKTDILIKNPIKKKIFTGDPTEEKAVDSIKETWETVIVKPGDSVSKLLLMVYGRVNENNLKLVHKHNPQIEDIDIIEVGQKIIFPPLPEKGK